jgi:hemoglobin
MSTASLYERLGQATGISQIVRDTIANHLKNPLVKARFENLQDLERVHRVVTEFFCTGAGGPEKYTGRELVAAHKGMNISEQEFLSAVDDIVAALEKNGIDPQTRSDVVGILYSLKAQVIRV